MKVCGIPCRANIDFKWLITAFELVLCNLAISMPLKSAHFVMIHYQAWPPQAILVSDRPIFKNLLL